MLYNDLFLQELFYSHNQKKYARITSLDYNESTQETIEGRITSGSVSVDGTSAVRRTCQLSMVTDEIDISNYYWTFNTKFKLEIGLENDINPIYPKIIWFPQGLFIITSFSSSLSATGYSINISGKDKMCLLNGENGGALPMEVNFGVYEEKDLNGDIKIIKNPLKDIIREAVHHYGGESYERIIINDLDNRGLELQEYKYDSPMYLIRKDDDIDSSYFQATLNGKQGIYNSSDSSTTIDSLKMYDFLLKEVDNSQSTKFELIKDSGKYYKAAKIVYGQTAGYTATEMTYTGDLIAKTGETITSVLDKIKQMLGNFEYFYDLDGNFVFQEQKNYINTAFTPIEKSEGLIWVNQLLEKTQFDFINSELFTSFNNSPNLNNLRNDLVVWGSRKSVNGKDYPIHMRYAIDEKPLGYRTIAVSEEDAKTLYGSNAQGQSSKMYLSEALQDQTITYGNNLYIPKSTSPFSLLNHPNAKMFYSEEQEAFVVSNISSNAEYYDWREIIYQMAVDYRKWNRLENFEILVAEANPELYVNGKTGYEQYYVDMESFWRQLYNPSPEEDDVDKFYTEGEYQFWAKAVYETPEQLNFWIDFLDTQGELKQFSVKTIGIRPKVVNDKDVRAIIYRETPEIIYGNINLNMEHDSGYVYFNFPSSYKKMFSQSAQGKSAKDAIDTLLYNHAYCIDSVSITSVPVYTLQPNKLIYISDKSSGIEGEYLLTKYTIPLAYNGTMNLTAVKAVDRII